MTGQAGKRYERESSEWNACQKSYRLRRSIMTQCEREEEDRHDLDMFVDEAVHKRISDRKSGESSFSNPRGR